jgi:zinc/manganese transport system permease protein
MIGRPLFFATVDPDVAQARRVPVRLLSTVFLLLLACAAAEVSQITGVLLVFALLVMPAASAQQITARPALGFLLSVVLSLVVTWLGLGVSYFSPYPVGFWITTFGFGIYVVVSVTRVLRVRAGRRYAGPEVVG